MVVTFMLTPLNSFYPLIPVSAWAFYVGRLFTVKLHSQSIASVVVPFVVDCSELCFLRCFDPSHGRSYILTLFCTIGGNNKAEFCFGTIICLLPYVGSFLPGGNSTGSPQPGQCLPCKGPPVPPIFWHRSTRRIHHRGQAGSGEGTRLLSVSHCRSVLAVSVYPQLLYCLLSTHTPGVSLSGG